MESTRVLILDADQRSALAATRSLGSKGIEVVTADCLTPTLSGCSRYSTDHEVYCSPENKRNFLADLSEIISRHSIKIVIPFAETTIYTIQDHRDQLPDVVIPIVDSDTQLLIANKADLVDLCEKNGVPAPKSIRCVGKQISEELLRDFNYPLVLKPSMSRVFYEGEWLNGSVKYAYSYSELVDICEREKVFQHFDFLIQEYIEGHGVGVFLLYEHGRLVAQFSHRRIREKPPSGGVSVLCESVAMDAKLLDYSTRVLEMNNWHGVAMVEWKVDANDKPFLMEINARFWGSLQLAVDAGVDFPYLLYLLCANRGVDNPVKNYRVGQRLRWLLGDLDRLYLVLRSKVVARDKLRSVAEFMKLFGSNTKYEINRISDPGPFLYELKYYIRNILGAGR